MTRRLFVAWLTLIGCVALGAQGGVVPRQDIAARCPRCDDAAKTAKAAAKALSDAEWDSARADARVEDLDFQLFIAKGQLEIAREDKKTDPLYIVFLEGKVSTIEKELADAKKQRDDARAALKKAEADYTNAIKGLDACNAECLPDGVIPIAGDSSGPPDHPSLPHNPFVQHKELDIIEPFSVPPLSAPVARVWFNPFELGTAVLHAAELPAGVHFLLTDRGGSTGKTLVLKVLNLTGSAVRLGSGPIAVRPIAQQSQQKALQAFQALSKAQPARVDVAGYCLEFLKAPPDAGTLYEIAPAAIQEKYAVMAKVLSSADHVVRASALHPDSDPRAYADSIKQWSLWSVEQNFNGSRFSDSLVDYTKKHAQAAGVKWSSQSEAQIRSAAPNRWRDVVSILSGAGIALPQ